MAKPIVDLKRSVWDKKASDPGKGQYVFTQKVYYKNKDFAEGYIHPFKIKWAKYSEDEKPQPFYSYRKWQREFEATPLMVGDDYWPEGFIPDAEGKYVDIDLVCVKIPIEVHVRKKKESVRRSAMRSKQIKQQFIDETKQAGADIPEEDMEQELERLKKEVETFGM